MSHYIAEVKGELKKTTWPWDADPKAKGVKKYKELAGATMVVLVATILLGAYVGLFDLILTKLVAWIVALIR